MSEQLTPEQKRALVAQLLRKKAAETKAIHPLSYGQRGLWFLQVSAPESVAYNIALCLNIHSEVNLPALKDAIQTLTDRHQSLRTIFTTQDGLPVQEIYEYREAFFQQVDASTLSKDELYEAVIAEYHRPFDLAKGPLVRWVLFAQSPVSQVLLFNIHHIVADGSSVDILLNELQVIYKTRVENATASLSQVLPAPRQYVDFVRWQTEYLSSPTGEASRKYWLENLGSDLPALNLPTDYQRPLVQTFNGASHIFELDKMTVQAVRDLAHQEGVTTYVVLLAAYYSLLHRLTGQETVIVGTPTLGRPESKFDNVFGYLVNPIPLQVQFADNPTIKALIKQVRLTLLGGLENQYYPVTLLAEQLAIHNDPSRSPIFQTFFNFFQLQRSGSISSRLGHNETIDFSGLKISNYIIPQEEGQFDVSLVIVELEDSLRCTFTYNTDLFNAATISRMADYWQTLLRSTLNSPDTRVSDLPLLPDTERQKILVDWNDTSVEYPADTGVHILFEQQAVRTPSRIAAASGKQQITYADLNARANQLANHLQKLGVQPDSMVGVHVERSLDMLVALFGVLKAGAAYVPMDPAFPRERLGFMIEDAGMPVIISQSTLADQLPEHAAQIVLIDSQWSQIALNADQNLPNLATGDNLAYVIFTSGSTGRPKGVQVLHRALTNFLLTMRERPGIVQDDVLLAITTLSFDIAGLELYLPLIVGAQVVLLSRESTWDGGQIAAAITEHNTTIMQATPASWQLLLESDWQGKPDLKMLIGGEALPPSLAERLLSKGQSLWNMYGPTETTIWSTIEQIVSHTDPITIGRPIANTNVYVLDNQLQPVPVGITGVLYIGGEGVARGYIQRPDLTAERFILNPFASGRIYNTGDIARWLPDGRLECLGRADYQVKIRGFRIELGEIETNLEAHPDVSKAVVVAREDQPGDKRLVAYVIGHEGAHLDTATLRDHVKAHLPAYMVPSAVVTMTAFPLTPNGKVDRKALPAPAQTKQESSRQLVGAQTDSEIMLVDMWRELLGVESISVFDNFFDLGGHSLQTFQVSTRIEEKTGYKIEPITLRMQSLKQLAASIDIATGRVQPSSNGHVADEQQTASNELPYFFSSGNESLYGVYYQAQADSAVKRGVVVCPPWGQEYIRTHRALHQMAVRLSDAGIPVLKFDYYGTGDSNGEDTDFAINRSVDDIASAIDQLRQRSGLDDIALVGLRLGGTLAALAHTKLGSTSRLALWDPIVNGHLYLDELAEWHKRNLNYYFGEVDQNPDSQTHEVLGFAMSETMRTQLNEADLLKLAWPTPKHMLLVERERNEGTAQLQTLLQSQHVPLHYQQIDGPQMWTENTDKGLVPHQTLEAIVSWIKES